MGAQIGLRVAFLLALMGLSSASGLHSQERDWGALRADATREMLSEALARLEEAARSRAYSDELRARARIQALAVRRRLEEGDFRVGERVVIYVEGQQALTDTFVVSGNQAVYLPVVGEVSLRGVLRAEFESHLAQQIGRFVNQPVVRAQSFIRLSVAGEVGQPGFYIFPADLPIPEALMSIGGPTVTANLSGLRIERGDERLLAGEKLQLALRDGLTLSELGLRSGDRIVVPSRPVSPLEIGRNVTIITALFLALDRIFGR